MTKQQSKIVPPFEVRVRAGSLAADYKLSAEHFDKIMRVLNDALGCDNAKHRLVVAITNHLRAKKLTASARKRIASNAAKAMWKKKRAARLSNE